MKFAIISDSHDHLTNIKKFLAYAKEHNIKTVLHCGDICNPDTFKLLVKNFDGNFHAVLGNGDYHVDELQEIADEFESVYLHGEEGKIVLDNKMIWWNHYPQKARQMAEENDYELIFYGHNHRPWEETIKGTKVLNPGNLDGSRYKATFAVYDTKTDKAKLILLESL